MILRVCEEKSVIKIFYDSDWGWKLVSELSTLSHFIYNRTVWACQEQAGFFALSCWNFISNEADYITKIIYIYIFLPQYKHLLE